MEVNAFESVRPRGAMPPLVRALLYPEKSAEVRPVAKKAPRVRVLPDGLMAARKWRIGAPPHVGWWKTRNGMSGAEWRWWDGMAWSWPVAPNAGDAAIAKAMRPWGDEAAIVWCWDWPDGARVPRINPATGEVTGGAK